MLMACIRRQPHHREHSSFSGRKYPLRRSPSSRRLRVVEDLSIISDIRQVLVPLHPNLRRLPSRSRVTEHLPPGKNEPMAHHATQVGSKRKRVASASRGNENVSHSTRVWTRSKRLRSDSFPKGSHPEQSVASEEDEEDENEELQESRRYKNGQMDADLTTTREPDSDDDHSSEDDEEEAQRVSKDDDESTDEYLLNSATARQLFRLRKCDLIRLYSLSGLSDDAESMNKSDIISAMVSARDDIADLPPSSPLGPASSEYSSDEGNVAGDEETDAGVSMDRANGSNLRRRATVGDVTKMCAKPVKGRSTSMDQLGPHKANGILANRKTTGKLPCVPEENTTRRHKVSRRSSPCTSTTNSVTTRTRSQRPSSSSAVCVPQPKKNSKGKKEVVHCEKTDSKAQESDLTELEELESQIKKSMSRKLRSDRKGAQTEAASTDLKVGRKVRRIPLQLMRGKTSLSKTSDHKTEGFSIKEDDMSVEEINDEAEEEEEVDELISSASATPTPPLAEGRRTPLQCRLRSRRRPASSSSDGDDEHDSMEEGEEADTIRSCDEDEATEVDIEDDEDEEAAVAVEPRRLRNGKIVEDVNMEVTTDEVDDEEDNDYIVEVGDEEQLQEGENINEDYVEADEEEEDAEEEVMEDDVDLTVATAKTLVRLRRDDLVRLCETRDLEPVGTKPQLAEALLQWRDRYHNNDSSPSSSGTARPPSTSKRRTRNGAKVSGGTISQTSEDRPATLVPTSVLKDKEKEEVDLELDLESLGLDDREIPTEKLQKLEKIGSGGFKDVFIGKFKGRKIAISEFRGQLNAMDIKELKLLGGFDHPNIVRFLGVSIPENTKETPVMIVSELCSNGDLFDFVRNVPSPSLHKVLAMMLDIARGLEYLHQRKPSVIHRDCKSSNILITAKGTAKIADFGLAKVKQSTRSMVRSLVGTVNWQAPELWHAHPKYNYKVDVFSCSMVFWEMLQWHLPNKKFPWEGMNEHAIYEIVGTKRQRPSLSGLRKQWCPEIIDLMERMWAQDPQDRPTMSEVVEALEEMYEHW